MQNHFDSQVCLCDWLKVQNQFFSGGVFQVLGFLFYRLSFHQHNFRFILSSLSRHQVFRLKFRSTLVLKGCVGFFLWLLSLSKHVVIFWQSQVIQNCRSGQFIFLFGKFRFCRKRFRLLSLLVIRRFGKFCFQPLPKSKFCVKLGHVGCGSGH